ncbi:transmembrane protein [Mycolicibacterium thermoresistibile ATCC 19527]|uniref:Transmembrane protein n=3 Tax=Mycolicibacterium thermoresistibile TaxID=1797 RepID=G7CH98_MYCT3|nr:transmembrane protein [Mycolicibacterium thermoresistibile ATCC 19527]GAT15574.1 transmembrane protein [Mycolicibacterium thermoresistibile]SNW16875.1 putative transmembrane protein [Mycolicibacterium thermoresistibile]
MTRGPKTDGVTGAADRARAALEVLGARARAVWAVVMPHLYGEPGETRSQRILRRVRIGLVIAACVITLQSVLLVVGAWRNDRQIERNMGVAEALVLDAGPRRSTIEFVTPERVTYRPELGVLYPSELDTGMRIYVEYDVNDPELVRVQDRNALLAIVPAGSIAVLGWIVVGAALVGLAFLQRRLESRTPTPAEPARTHTSG